MEITEKDRELLALMRENARLSTSDLARRLKLSRTTVQSRIDRLESRGVIGGYTVRLGPNYERNLIEAYILVNSGPKHTAGVENAIRRISEVHALYSVSGPYDMIAAACAETVDKMNDVIDAIGAIEGVEKTMSSLVMSRRFRRN